VAGPRTRGARGRRAAIGRRWALAAGIVAALGSARAAGAQPGPPEDREDGAVVDDADGVREDGQVDAGPAPPVVWRYRTPGGREAFTGHLGRIPSQAQDVAPVDLSEVSLNVALGNDLRDRIAEQLAAEGLALPDRPLGGALPAGDERLDEEGVVQALDLEKERAEMVRSEACAEAREGDGPDRLIERLWTDHLHLPVLAVLALLLVAAGPAMARRISAPQWIRFVTFVLPLLGFLGFTTSTVVEAARLQRRMREAVRVCDPALVLGPLDSAQALTERLELVDALRAVTTKRGL